MLTRKTGDEREKGSLYQFSVQAYFGQTYQYLVRHHTLLLTFAFTDKWYQKKENLAMFWDLNIVITDRDIAWAMKIKPKL